MPGSEIPDLQGVFRFVSRLHTMSKRGMRGALADCPRCHFGMLENLHILIEQRGVEGAIYVSEVARAMRQPMPAVSRGLRMMEQDLSLIHISAGPSMGFVKAGQPQPLSYLSVEEKSGSPVTTST